jgi:two-component system NtrC family response regulator
MSGKILLIEDEARLRRILEMVLKDHGFSVKSADNGEKGIAAWNQWNPDIVITDIKMEPIDGFEVLRFGQKRFSRVPVIILTAFGTVETAVTAMKQGAFDFLTKPVNHQQLIELIGQAMVSNKKRPVPQGKLIGSSGIMMKIKEDIRLFASTDSAVLIRGESGTGKELVARAIHNASKRAAGPMVRVNCAAIPRDLLESEFFGHKRGAFTGAVENRKGAFEKADGGILFLDEIGDLPFKLQPKLLHAVEEKVVTPVGSASPRPVSVKILSATNLDLDRMVSKNLFRSDLFYRLNTVSITMPPLRDRMTDMDMLTRYFLENLSSELDEPTAKIDAAAKKILQTYSWPGNVRELKNVLERAVLLSRGNIITPEHLGLEFNRDREKSEDTVSKSMDLVAQEQNLLITALTRYHWNQSKAARELSITRSALRYRLQKYGLTPYQN